jgi:ABC-2 type transport system permease protein
MTGGLSWTRFRAIVRKETIQIRRDRRSMLMAFVMPLLLLVFFGYAVTLDIARIQLAVLDQDRTPESRRLVEALVASNHFVVTRWLERYGQVQQELDAGRVSAVAVISPGFMRDLAAAGASHVQLLVDASDANTATIALGYADALVSAHGARLRTAGITPAVTAHTRIRYNPELRSRVMMVPALIAVIMSIIAAQLTALTIAREWERGTMEQLAATPAARAEIVLGKLVPYAVIGLIDVTITVLAGMFVFDVPLRGNVLLLAVLSVMFLVGALGLGMFLSAALRSQMLATQATMLVTVLPAILLSGYIFEISGMPAVLRGITYLIPARYFVAVTRGIFLKGAGLDVLWPEALAMLAFATLGLGLATRLFRKEVL